MQNEYFEMMKSIAPDLAQEIELRALVLERIGALAPVGRRQLAQRIHLPEREIRTLATVLRDNGLIRLDASGMSLTEKAEAVLPAARLFSRDLRGLTGMESELIEKLDVDKVCIVPGDTDTDPTILHEVGKNAASRLKGYLQSGTTLAVTGGSTIREVADALPVSTPLNIMVVPARGGIGRSLETQSNTIAEEIAKRLGGHHRLMYLPDRLDEQAMVEMRKLKEVDETLALLERADVVLHGIGRADKMCQKRQLPLSVQTYLMNKGAVAEAYSCFFDLKGKQVYSVSTVSHDIGILKPNCALIAVAAGSSKAEAILSIMRNRHHALLVTDEGAAKRLLDLLQA